MSNSLSLLLFTLFIFLFNNSHALDDKEIKKVFENFGVNLFQELDQFSSFPDKDSKAISLQHKLDSVPYSRSRRSFPDNAGNQQAGEFADTSHLDGISRDAFLDSSPDMEQSKSPESNSLVSEQIINKSSAPDKMAPLQNEFVQKPLPSQNNVAVKQAGMDLPGGNALGNDLNQQHQKQPLVKTETNVANPSQSNNKLQQIGPVQSNTNILPQAAQAQNTANGLQQAAQALNTANGLQQAPQAQNTANGLQQAAQAQNTANGLQQAAQAQNTANGLQQLAQAQNPANRLQQAAQAQNTANSPQQAAQTQNITNGLQQAAQAQINTNKIPQGIQAENHANKLQQSAQVQLKQVAQAQNKYGVQKVTQNDVNGLQQPFVQAPSNNVAHASEQNSLNQLALNQNGQSNNGLDQIKTYMPAKQQSLTNQNSLPLNKQDSAVAKPGQSHQIIDTGGLPAKEQNHLIDNSGLSADQQKPAFIRGQYVDKSVMEKQQVSTKIPNSPSELTMDNNLRPVYISSNHVNVQPEDQPKSYVTSQPNEHRQISVTQSKESSSSSSPFFLISTIRNIPYEPEHNQENGKQDDSWYYNQEIDDSLHQGVTESEKHAGKQLLMSAHHFDIPLGALAGTKMFNNDDWQKNHKPYLMNKKSETFEPMNMALFYSWIALATLAVLGILTILRHRHKVTGYVYDLRHWHNGAYVEEGRRLLHNAYA